MLASHKHSECGRPSLVRVFRVDKKNEIGKNCRKSDTPEHINTDLNTFENSLDTQWS